MLHDQHQWKVGNIGRRWVGVWREDDDFEYAKSIRTKSWVNMEVIKVHSKNSSVRRRPAAAKK